MTREEKCLLAIEKGFTYNPETGDVFGIKGNLITGKNNGYITFSLYVNNKYYYLRAHQFAWYWVNKECVDCLDHINGVRDDNRISNLRSVTHQENMINSKAKGYYWHNQNKNWCAKIRNNNIEIFLGSFEIEEDARNAYLEAKKIYHKIKN
jgi:hypothetical protein